MYSNVNELKDLEPASGNNFTPKHLIEIGIKLIENSNEFEKELTEWFDLPTPDKIWPRFQTHFDQARASLHQVRGVTIRNIAYHQQVNATTEKVLK